MAANIQQVRYPVPDNQPPAWAQGLQGMVQGVSGYYDRRAQEQKNMMALLPVLAQMKMLTPGGKDIKVPGSNLSFGVNTPTTDYGEQLSKLKGQQLGYELNPSSQPVDYQRKLKEVLVDRELIQDFTYQRMIKRKEYSAAAKYRQDMIDLATGVTPEASTSSSASSGKTGPKNWSEVSIPARVWSALTLSMSPSEKALGQKLTPRQIFRPPSKYTDSQEKMIKDNMDAYGRSREEVIQALKRKGKL
jgi:hypothetical protein